MQLPSYKACISIYPTAVATFYAPSDLCGVGGMRSEQIRALPNWRNSSCGRFDCVFIWHNDESQIQNGPHAFDVARVRLFFVLLYNRVRYTCALVHDFCLAADSADEDTGMWIVCPAFDLDHHHLARVITLSSVYRAAHLVPVFGYEHEKIAKHTTADSSLDDFDYFYINKFIDHHAFEIAF
jgi:hypothetical protein